MKWSDFDGNLLRVQRRIYNGDVGKVKSLRSVRSLPLDGKLIDRINTLRSNREWVFCSEAGTPVDPGNARRRYLRPATALCGIVMGGWHDFRHTLSTKMRKAGVHPKVISDLLGHSKVNLAMDVYDRTDAADFSGPLSSMSDELLSNASNSQVPSH
ncbi:MAG: tyrosine-type recombinase/integrase [Candidatus Sulfotelmatobacter sp.]